MKELYVSQFAYNGRQLVMIYTSAEYLKAYVNSPPDPWPDVLGTINRSDLGEEDRAAISAHGWRVFEVELFKQKYREHLVSR